jgi:hypothetical protein
VHLVSLQAPCMSKNLDKEGRWLWYPQLFCGDLVSAALNSGLPYLAGTDVFDLAGEGDRNAHFNFFSIFSVRDVRTGRLGGGGNLWSWCSGIICAESA